jgi:outer membrane lipoprotein-sorting protein
MTLKMRSKASLLTPSSRFFALVLVCLPAYSAALSLNEVLAKLDQNAQGFRAMTAKIERLDYTAILKDTSKESGNIVLLRRKGSQVEMRIDIALPSNKNIGYAEKKVQIYLPKLNTVQIYDVGKYDSLISQGLLIGFGTSAQDLQKSYNLKILAEEQVGGKASTRVELTPKGSSPLLSLKKIEVWFGNQDGYPVQQKLFENSGDYKLATYTEMKINPAVKDQDVRLALPKNVKKEFPAK